MNDTSEMQKTIICEILPNKTTSCRIARSTADKALCPSKKVDLGYWLNHTCSIPGLGMLTRAAELMFSPNLGFLRSKLAKAGVEGQISILSIMLSPESDAATSSPSLLHEHQLVLAALPPSVRWGLVALAAAESSISVARLTLWPLC